MYLFLTRKGISGMLNLGCIFLRNTAELQKHIEISNLRKNISQKKGVVNKCDMYIELTLTPENNSLVNNSFPISGDFAVEDI